MGAPAARLNDSVLGADTHIVMVPARHRLRSHPDPGPRVLGDLDFGCVPGREDRRRRGGRGRHGGDEQPAAHPHASGRVVPEPAVEPRQGQPGSTTVTINGKAAARVGDPVKTCNDPTDLDTSAIVSGAAKVTIG